MNIVLKYNKWLDRFTLPENVWKRIGDLEYSVRREMAPVYTMGSSEPMNLSSRGRQSVSGSFKLLIGNEEDLKEMVNTIEKHGIRIKKEINEMNGNTYNAIYTIEGVSIVSSDNIQFPIHPVRTLDFVAKRIKVQQIP